MYTFYGKKQIFDYFEPVLSLPCPSAPILVDFLYPLCFTYKYLFENAQLFSNIKESFLNQVK